MIFNADRMLHLSGLSSRDEHQTSLLAEDRRGKAQPAGRKLSSVNEAALRRAIRRELRLILPEILAAKGEKAITAARRTGRLADAMGMHNVKPLASPNRSSNRAFCRGPGYSMGFGGPGFM